MRKKAGRGEISALLFGEEPNGSLDKYIIAVF